MELAFERNIDISEAHIEHALTSRESFRALLDRAAAVAQPEDGGPKVLMACAALVNAPWLDGQLRVEVEGDDHATRLSILIDAGFRERLFPVVTLNVPFDEFARAVRLVPRLIAPLALHEKNGVLILTQIARQPRPSAHPTQRRMAAVVDDVHTKPTVVRMTAVRPESLREDADDD
jgi:hypothetical protein